MDMTRQQSTNGRGKLEEVQTDSFLLKGVQIAFFRICEVGHQIYLTRTNCEPTFIFIYRTFVGARGSVVG
jgi:hypothetical protein